MSFVEIQEFRLKQFQEKKNDILKTMDYNKEKLTKTNFDYRSFDLYTYLHSLIRLKLSMRLIKEMQDKELETKANELINIICNVSCSDAETQAQIIENLLHAANMSSGHNLERALLLKL